MAPSRPPRAPCAGCPPLLAAGPAPQRSFAPVTRGSQASRSSGGGGGTWSDRAAGIRESGGQAPAGPAGESQPEPSQGSFVEGLPVQRSSPGLRSWGPHYKLGIDSHKRQDGRHGGEEAGGSLCRISAGRGFSPFPPPHRLLSGWSGSGDSGEIRGQKQVSSQAPKLLGACAILVRLGRGRRAGQAQKCQPMVRGQLWEDHRSLP